jgi:hypothetical protein
MPTLFHSQHLLLVALCAAAGFLLVSSGLFVPISAATGPSFSVGPVVQVSPNHSPFPKSCAPAAAGGTFYYNAKDEPKVDVNPTNPSNIIGTYQQDRFSNGGDDGNVVAYSTNGGANWTIDWPTFTHCEGGNKHNNGDFERASDPWVSFSPNGVAYVSALTFNMSYNSASGVEVSKSTDGGKTWSKPALLILGNSLSDKDSVTADPTNSSYAYVVWDLFGTGAQIYFSRTTNGGNTWSTGREIFGAATVNNIVLVLPSGKLLDTFTDDSSGDIEFITSTNHGTTWSSSAHVISSQDDIGVTDPRTGQFVRTGAGLASLTVDEKTGYIYAVWEDARFSGVEAIAFSMSKDGGSTWSNPIQVNKSPSGVQAFTPTVQVDSKGTVAVTYYDFRHYKPGDRTTPTDLWMVECSSSCTKKASWTEQHVSGSFNIENAPNTDSGCCFLGDYSALGNMGSGFLPFWVQAVNNLNYRTDMFAATATG